MASARPTSVPAPGQVAPPAADAAQLLRRNRDDPSIAERPAVLFGDRVWTHREFVEESTRWANLFGSLLPEERPPHIGVLLDNTPDYLFALGGAALSGATVVGLNHTRQGEHLLRDVVHADVGLLVTEPRHVPRIAEIRDGLGFADDRILVSRRFAERDNDCHDDSGRLGLDLDVAVEAEDSIDAGLEPGGERQWALIFTSGTSAAPKAVICSQRRLLGTGTRMSLIMDLGPDDVGYVCMPLFHSNALMVGWAPSLVTGGAVALARRFSASGWLPDVRRYRATYFNYTGKPLSYLVATAEAPDDADNSMRVAFGNEGSPEVVEVFGRRFGVEVIDAFGATEGGIAVSRDGPDRPGAMGVAGESIRIVDEDGNERLVARFDDDGRLVNAEECVGEIVNTAGAGPFEGYYNNPEATARTLRNGWYWSGDLGYLDADRYLYFAGRNAEWIRVDGENFPAGPIESTVSGHPDVVLAAVYGVPDSQAGDQVMAALLLVDGASFDPMGFARWLDGLTDIGPKWRPRYVRIVSEFPTTGTNKVVKRTLVHEKVRHDRVDDDVVFVRERGDAFYRVFTAADESTLRDAFERAGRLQFWDL